MITQNYCPKFSLHTLMWQTVISFDNAWLTEMGIYDAKEKQLDEKTYQAAYGKTNDFKQNKVDETQLNLNLSHMNSKPRKVLGYDTPYQVFSRGFPERCT